ncbi:unnamed protein product [Chilo suppressalis]|uniref:MADF domain-containing protein n=1 Tax=Chilo suppressalis TaxID=168631 RepID=A0ABN8B1Q5_CHISP|nr:unnamed protein product [Chilo suppressalis]
MDSQNIDSEDFINEVRKHPEIWDINCDDYRYPKRRQRAWAKVASAFLVNFEYMPSSEKTIIQKRLNDKWRNIRDSYVKSKRINQKKLYMYSAYLYFLDDIYKDGEDTGNEETPKIKMIKKEKRHYDDSNEAWPSDDSNLESKRKKIDSSMEFVDFPEMALPCSTVLAEDDDDHSFFNCLLPAVRQFSMDQKLEFRSEVIDIIKKIRAADTAS